jgi:rhodanese-related sulfurtransferase
MIKLSEILGLAQQRGRELKLPYEGALTPKEAHAVWQHAPGAKLVDCRTRAEWDFVGRIPGAIEIEWQFYPGHARNPHFLDELRHAVSTESLLIIVCRSGHRSHHAAIAATEAGYPDCYNVLEGFQGNKDANGHRDKLGGWRAAGLPWHQG